MPNQPARPTEALNAFGQPTKNKKFRGTNQTKATRLCKFCQREFTPIRPWQLFCNTKHRNAYWNIEHILNKDE